MTFHSKRMFSERQEPPRKYARVQSTASVNKVDNKKPIRRSGRLFDICLVKARSEIDKLSDECWERAFSNFYELFDECWDKYRGARALLESDEDLDKCWDRCWARELSDLLQQDLTDAPHQDEVAISQYRRREEKEAEVITYLPEEIVEKIIAMVPFPSIFKAVGLSKAWQARFMPSMKSPEAIDLSKSSASGSCRFENGENGENERCLATHFQKQVIGEWSKDWETFSPVFIAYDHLFTYGQKSRNWRRISLSVLPKIFLQSKTAGKPLDMDALQIEGTLMYISHSTVHIHEMYVADILTQQWKQLPSPPQDTNVFCSKVVSNTSLGTYKVIVFSADSFFDDRFSAHVYDSNSETWSTEQFSVSVECYDLVNYKKESAGAAYLNGVLYMVEQHLQSLLAFNLAEKTLEELELSFNGKERDMVWDNLANYSTSLLVCNNNRLIVTRVDIWGGRKTVHLLEIDLHSLQMIPLCSGPPPSFRVNMIIDPDPRPVSDGNCIFFYTKGHGGPKVLAYNVTEDAWSSFPVPTRVARFNGSYHWICCSLRPSLSAFVSL